MAMKLHISSIRATNLAYSIHNGFSMSPYVDVTVNRVVLRTEKAAGQNPAWVQGLIFQLHNIEESVLFEIWQECMVNVYSSTVTRENLGRASIRARDLLADPQGQRLYRLYDPSNRELPAMISVGATLASPGYQASPQGVWIMSSAVPSQTSFTQPPAPIQVAQPGQLVIPQPQPSPIPSQQPYPSTYPFQNGTFASPTPVLNACQSTWQPGQLHQLSSPTYSPSAYGVQVVPNTATPNPAAPGAQSFFQRPQLSTMYQVVKPVMKFTPILKDLLPALDYLVKAVDQVQMNKSSFKALQKVAAKMAHSLRCCDSNKLSQSHLKDWIAELIESINDALDLVDKYSQKYSQSDWKARATQLLSSEFDAQKIKATQALMEKQWMMLATTLQLPVERKSP